MPLPDWLGRMFEAVDVIVVTISYLIKGEKEALTRVFFFVGVFFVLIFFFFFFFFFFVFCFFMLFLFFFL